MAFLSVRPPAFAYSGGMVGAAGGHVGNCIYGVEFNGSGYHFIFFIIEQIQHFSIDFSTILKVVFSVAAYFAINACTPEKKML